MFSKKVYAAVFLAGAVLGVALDKAHALPLTEEKQMAMVLTATEIMEQAQCGAAEKPITKIRFNMWTKADHPAFLTTMDAIAQIYLADPARFCRRAALAAGK